MVGIGEIIVNRYTAGFTVVGFLAGAYVVEWLTGSINISTDSFSRLIWDILELVFACIGALFGYRFALKFFR